MNAFPAGTTIACFNVHLYLAALKWAAVGDVRYYLNGVCVQKCPEGGVILIATDGHRLVAIRDESGMLADGTPESGLIIPAMKLPGVSLAVSAKRKTTNLRIMATDGVAFAWRACVDVSGYETASYAVSGIDGRYPDWRAVVPQKAEACAATAVQPAYLGDIEAIGAGFNKSMNGNRHQCIAKIHPAGERAMLVTFSEPAVGVIMSMRDNCPDAAPSWIAVAQTVSEPEAGAGAPANG